MADIRLATHPGFHAIEFDVMLGADGTPVLIRDETPVRTANGYLSRPVGRAGA